MKTSHSCRRLKPEDLETDSYVSTAPLTVSELAMVPDGTPINVVWSGGNGPYEYLLRRDEMFGPWAALNGLEPLDLKRLLERFGTYPLTEVRVSHA